jgi:hypothetical protein
MPQATCYKSRHPKRSQELFNLGLIELPLPASAHHPLPSSGIPTRRNSNVSDVSAAGTIQGKERVIEVDTTDPNFVLDIFPTNSDQDRNQDQADDFDPYPDLEAGSSIFYTDTDTDSLAAIMDASGQFQRDHPELTEHVIF